MNKRTLAIGAAGSAFCVMALVGVASAATGAKPASLASEIAQKFNLKPADVQSVIDSHKGEIKMFHETEQKDRIAQAVKDGKITQTLADQLIAKEAELHPASLTLGTKPTESERTAMKAKMSAFRQWVKDNKIPENLVRPFDHRGRGMHGGMMTPSDQN
jgi:hypothetical protein